MSYKKLAIPVRLTLRNIRFQTSDIAFTTVHLSKGRYLPMSLERQLFYLARPIT
ncbi:hypothetical protein GPLA_2808 [Paraglaciecola polaris LMG 21857]|uniref:Uncharacterized protein n=1 Tax=Paraglaciecola polaris LMG 21857 TaxID=1129793 RepID=K6ZTU0_9ALTE|nr:hypothetical protein GPLA_2808 [Paraglaciecola polaris LMG 21857]